MKLFVAGISYKTAPVALREKLAVHASQLQCHGCSLKLRGGLSEVVVVSTCNRVEIYGVSTDDSRDPRALFRLLSAEPCELDPYIYVKESGAALEHLFSVAGGLDSLVLGETEITGQIKQAYQAAQSARLTGRVLNRVFQTALSTAKLIRSRTGIGRGATSVGSVAVELAERIFAGNLSERTVMIIGAGKMGEACVKHLAKKGARSVLVSNRSFERAELLAAEFGGRAIRFDDCTAAMEAADIVVSSTGCPHTILNRSDVARVMSARRNRPLVLIDIAVPRDIAADVQHLDNVYLYNVDDLEMIVRENVKQREHELSRCEDIIADAVSETLDRINPPGRHVPGALEAGLALFQPADCSAAAVGA